MEFFFWERDNEYIINLEKQQQETLDLNKDSGKSGEEGG
jgi:hypothetical protein